MEWVSPDPLRHNRTRNFQIMRSQVGQECHQRHRRLAHIGPWRTLRVEVICGFQGNGLYRPSYLGCRAVSHAEAQWQRGFSASQEGAAAKGLPTFPTGWGTGSGPPSAMAPAHSLSRPSRSSGKMWRRKMRKVLELTGKFEDSAYAASLPAPSRASCCSVPVPSPMLPISWATMKTPRVRGRDPWGPTSLTRRLSADRTTVPRRRDVTSGDGIDRPLRPFELVSALLHEWASS